MKIIVWHILAVLWIPFEVIYIVVSSDNTGKFSISKIGQYISDKIYKVNK